MKSRQKSVILVLAVCAIIGLFILASGIASLDLNNTPLYLLPESQQATRAPVVGSAIQNSASYLSILSLVFLVILPLSFIYLMISPSARRRFIIQMVQIVVIAFFMYFLTKNIGTLFPKLNLGLSGSSKDDLASRGLQLRFLEPFTPKSPVWLTQVLSFGLAIAFVYLLYWLWRRYRRSEDRRLTPTQRLVLSAQSALRQIDAGQNLRDVVLRCYHEMTRVVAEKHHLIRPEHITPHEFVRSLEGVGLPAEQVQRLTNLFAMVRYGHKIPGAPERAEAVACLNAVVERLGSEL